jgi:hypothetical protein
MDILDQYFGEEMQKYMPKFELGTVYSDPYASAFRKIEEGPSTKKLRIFDFDDTLAKVKANIIVKNKDKEFTLTPAEFAVYVPKTGDAFNFKCNSLSQLYETLILNSLGLSISSFF